MAEFYIKDYNPVNEHSRHSHRKSPFFLVNTIEIGGFSSQLFRNTRGYPVQFGFVDPNFVRNKLNDLNDLLDLKKFGMT